MTTPVANTTHDIVVTRGSTATGFMIEPRSYRVARANDFSPRISTGKPTHSDLDLWNTIDIENFNHGIGAEYVRDDTSTFLESDGELETAVSGQVTLASKWVSSDASFVAYKFIDYGNYMYAGGATSVRQYDPSGNTWANSDTGLSSAVTDMKVCFGKLYVGFGTAAHIREFNGSAWSETTGTKHGYCFEVWKTKLWRGDAGNLISYDGSSDVTVAIGDSSTNITALCAQDNYLIIFKDDGRIYTYDGTTVLDLLTNPAYTGNYKYCAQHLGWLYYGVLSDVHRISGINTTPALQKITPKNVDSDTYGWGLPVSFTSSPNFLYCFFTGAENSYPVLLKYNQSGWHVVYKGKEKETGYSCYYSRVSGRLWVNDGASRYQRVTTVTDTPYPDYALSTTRSIYLSHMTAGFDDIDKVWRDIKVITENCTEGVKLDFYYQKDRSGSWVSMGSVTSNPQTTIAFSSGTAISAKDLWIRIDFVTDDADVSPKLKAMYVSYLTRPATVWAISCNIILEDEQTYKDASGEETQTMAQKLAELQTISDTIIPVSLDGIDDLTYKVIQTNITWQEAVEEAYEA